MMKRALLVGLVLVAGCEKKKAASGPADCDVVSKDPANAVAEISKRYPKDPVKVAKTIENCVAPAGDICDRVAAMVKAIPAMTPGTNAPRSAEEYAKTCFASPPEMRKCFLASYALAHEAECKKMMMDMANAAMTNVPMKRPECDGGQIAVLVTKEGAWIATGEEPKTGRCFRERKGGALDVNGIEGELAQFKTKDCKPSVVLAAEDDVKYQDMILVMDVAVKVGLLDVGLAAVSELPVSFTGAEPATSAEHCPATVIATGGSTGSTTVGHQTTLPATAPTNAPAALATAQVLIISRTAISLSGAPASNLSGSGTTPAAAPAKEILTIDAAAKGSGTIDELAKALPKPASPDVPLILQADQNTSALVITRVIATAKAAGYDNVLFAVKNK